MTAVGRQAPPYGTLCRYQPSNTTWRGAFWMGAVEHRPQHRLGCTTLSSTLFQTIFPAIAHDTAPTTPRYMAVNAVSAARIDGRTPYLTAHRRLFWLVAVKLGAYAVLDGVWPSSTAVSPCFPARRRRARHNGTFSGAAPSSTALRGR